MGIKHLWTLLTPFCERKPLYELQGKTVAVDLSCWICEAQNIADYQVQPRMYLRNLYFRTCYLLLMDVNPVFVLEGKAPELKYDTITARNAIQFKGAKPKTDGVKTGKDRSRFHFVLKRCEEMLSYMGLVCVTGCGEAESLCAYLNDEGLVDGCISQDSDCFAYGAKVVYRNFSIASQGAHAASGGAVDIYDITRAFESMNFGRNKIIAMALLCGSDYTEGVQGIGKESVLKLFDKISDEEILERLRSWRKDIELYKKFENLVSDKNICTSCGHNGKLQSHNKKGCTFCGTTTGCDPFKFREERMNIKNELNIRKKALEDPNFPDERLINEFLVKKDNMSSLNLKWKQPNLVSFVNFTTKFLQWDEIYGFEKILPILTRWQCLHPDLIKEKNHKGILYPKCIKKIRNPKGIPSYEIIWTDEAGYFKGLIPDQMIQENNVDIEKLWSTIEPQVLVDKAYPKLVEEFNDRKTKSKKNTKRKKKESNVDEIGELMKNTSLSDLIPPKIRKTSNNKKVRNEVEKKENAVRDMVVHFAQKKNGPLDNFLKTAVLNSHKQKDQEKTEFVSDENQCFTSTPKKCKEDINLSRFSDEDNDIDLSDIVESIISRKPDYIIENLNKFKLQLDVDNFNNDNCNSSSFFITNPVENDMFEKTFNEADDSGESTDEYCYDENEYLENHKVTTLSYVNENIIPQSVDEKMVHQSQMSENEDTCDSFCDTYIPLLERLKNKNK
ncbi:XPG-like endonuclease isoform X1 [Leptinotarsa decemlineata]|uniref:XPG-like endonuclease isoform X1 n=1 Tax=Leptinotarsa decemlineata TaxID=7539 RepID=UPI003D307C24